METHPPIKQQQQKQEQQQQQQQQQQKQQQQAANCNKCLYELFNVLSKCSILEIFTASHEWCGSKLSKFHSAFKHKKFIQSK